MSFIILFDNETSVSIRVNINHLIGYGSSGKGSYISISESNDLVFVKESPEIIDKMLQECYVTVKFTGNMTEEG